MIRRSWAVFSTLDCHQAILTQRLNHRHFLNVRRYFKLVNMKDSDALHLENIAITSISTAFLMCPRHIIYEYHRLWSTFCVNDFVCCHVGVEAYEREWQMQFNNFTVNKIIWISPASCSLVHTNTKTHSHTYVQVTRRCKSCASTNWHKRWYRISYWINQYETAQWCLHHYGGFFLTSEDFGRMLDHIFHNST